MLKYKPSKSAWDLIKYKNDNNSFLKLSASVFYVFFELWYDGIEVYFFSKYNSFQNLTVYVF